MEPEVVHLRARLPLEQYRTVQSGGLERRESHRGRLLVSHTDEAVVGAIGVLGRIALIVELGLDPVGATLDLREAELVDHAPVAVAQGQGHGIGAVHGSRTAVRGPLGSVDVDPHGIGVRVLDERVVLPRALEVGGDGRRVQAVGSQSATAPGVPVDSEATLYTIASIVLQNYY